MPKQENHISRNVSFFWWLWQSCRAREMLGDGCALDDIHSPRRNIWMCHDYSFTLLGRHTYRIRAITCQGAHSLQVSLKLTAPISSKPTTSWIVMSTRTTVTSSTTNPWASMTLQTESASAPSSVPSRSRTSATVISPLRNSIDS